MYFINAYSLPELSLKVRLPNPFLLAAPSIFCTKTTLRTGKPRHCIAEAKGRSFLQSFRNGCGDTGSCTSQ